MSTQVIYNRLLLFGSVALAVLIVGAVTIPAALAVGIKLTRLILGGV